MDSFTINPPTFGPKDNVARFSYALGDLNFTETLQFPSEANATAAKSPAFIKLLHLTAMVLGVSYFKLRAPLEINAPELMFTEQERAFIVDVYENGLAEFYTRNNLKRFGKLNFNTASDSATISAPSLQNRTLLPIGGGKDSLVSVQLLEMAGEDFTPFAVNPKGPILTSVDKIARPPLYVTRTLDKEMIRLGQQDGFYNGHVPSTAINSMIAALCAILCDYNRIILSNERSASQGNTEFDGREINHQHSKSLAFETIIADVLAKASGGALSYFSLLRPYSEARIAKLFAREQRFDRVFSSCNNNFKLSGNDGPLWCGTCPKCHFTFLILAAVMDKQRLLDIFGDNLLAKAENEEGYRQLTGLAGQKPWECVGEILEAAACLWTLTTHPDWQDDPLVKKLGPELQRQYGSDTLEVEIAALHVDTENHLVPPQLAKKVTPHAL